MLLKITLHFAKTTHKSLSKIILKKVFILYFFLTLIIRNKRLFLEYLHCKTMFCNVNTLLYVSNMEQLKCNESGHLFTVDQEISDMLTVFKSMAVNKILNFLPNLPKWFRSGENYKLQTIVC